MVRLPALVCFVVAFSVTTMAQEPPAVTATFANLTRVESWSFFAPYPAAAPGQLAGNADYTFIGDRAELGVRVAGRRFDFGGAFNYVRLENVPTGAIGPGGLGVGAFYFAATGLSYSYQLYLSELFLRVSARDDRSSATLGRMSFASGAEFTSEDPSLDHLKRERLQSRLVGNFEWSYYQRRFDGVRVDIARPAWHVTAAALLPTQGGFEESTNLSMPNVQVATASYTRKKAGEFQAFGTLYRDRRELVAVVDNTLSPDRPVDVTIAALGGSHARITPTRSGELDTVLWGAVETGDWYGQSHRAASVAAEVGHRWPGVAGRPWLRAGYLWASGDGDPADDRHGTFFQMLPSSRKYALSATYAQMNLTDAFVQAAFEPRGVKTRIEVHAVGLASGQDLWYHGSGATASTGRYFGFSGRAAGGHSRLGTLLEGLVDVPLKTYWSVNAYVGTMWGGGVVTHNFSGDRLTFWYLENVFRF